MIIVSKPKILCNIVWTLKKISQRGDRGKVFSWKTDPIRAPNSKLVLDEEEQEAMEVVLGSEFGEVDPTSPNLQEVVEERVNNSKGGDYPGGCVINTEDLAGESVINTEDHTADSDSSSEDSSDSDSDSSESTDSDSDLPDSRVTNAEVAAGDSVINSEVPAADSVINSEVPAGESVINTEVPAADSDYIYSRGC